MIIVYEKLKQRAEEAISQKDYAKAWRIYGQTEMAYECGRITWGQMNELTVMLVDNGLQNPDIDWRR